jgi:hypothetical protein
MIATAEAAPADTPTYAVISLFQFVPGKPAQNDYGEDIAHKVEAPILVQGPLHLILG